MLDPQYVFVMFVTAAITIGTIVAVGLQSPRHWCPGCGAILPQFRIPTSLGEGWRREWTCHRCDLKIDGDGRQIVATESG